MRPQVIAITGPTASGKTGLATKLYDLFDIEIINMDSAQIYQEMNIGSAKLSPKELQEYPHHLIDICLPTSQYSVAQFVSDAKQLIDEIVSRQKIPMLVGGTMLYYKALSEGLSDLPSADPVLREALKKTIQAKGHEALYKELEQIDPKTAARIQGNDTQRLIRFIEIFRLTGKSPSLLFEESAPVAPKIDFLHIAFLPDDRKQLHQRIETRFDEMLALGFVDEVLALIQKYHLTENHQSMRSVGYRQIYQYLKGDLDYMQMREKGIVATRQLAKRQYTWLRKLPKDLVITDPNHFSIQAVIEKIKTRGYSI